MDRRMKRKEKTRWKMNRDEKESMEEFAVYLRERENAKATIRKYLTDIRTFYNFMGENQGLPKSSCFPIKNGWLNIMQSAV